MGTATTLKHDSETSTRAEFSWTFPGAPIRVSIPLNVISRLRAELIQNLANGTPGAEIGGVLLGHQDSPTTLHIDDYVWASSEERADGRYHLDRSELQLLRSIYSSPVGYFRTQSEDSMQLRDAEIDFVGDQFRDPTDVVLLIRATPQQYTAGFFFWMEAGVFSPFSFMDFPLDAELLQEREKPHLAAARTHGSASALETTLLPSGQAEKIEPAEPQRTAPIEITKEGVSQQVLVTAGVVFALISLAGLAAFGPHDRAQIFAGKQESPTPRAAFPLQLDVEAQGSGLNVRWNTQSTPIIKAREGHLIIREDHTQPRMIKLDQQQLTSGHIYYRSSAEQVQFQLEVVDASGSVSKESVVALSSKPLPALIPVAPQARRTQLP